jgi:lysyl-tRNA synthetase, class II
MVAAIRGFLNERGFLEFQTPVIQPQYGGGTAKPFKTHVNALGCDMYLAISHELYLEAPDRGGLTTRSIPSGATSATKGLTAAITRSSPWSKP